MKWLIILGYTVVYTAVMQLYDRLTKEKEKVAKIRERAKKGDVREEDLLAMNKIMLRRMLFSFILFLPALLVFRTWGDIETPLGTMGWLWWFLICMLVINLALGVLTWLRRTRGG